MLGTSVNPGDLDASSDLFCQETPVVGSNHYFSRHVGDVTSDEDSCESPRNKKPGKSVYRSGIVRLGEKKEVSDSERFVFRPLIQLSAKNCS